MKGCETHCETNIQPPQSYEGACRTPTIRLLPRRARDADQTVAEEVDATEDAVLTKGRDPSESACGPCPLCPDGGPRVRCFRSWDGTPPTTLVFGVAPPGLVDGVAMIVAPEPSQAILAHGKAYRLVAVMYDHFGGHFSVQVLYRGCWYYYDDLFEGIKAKHVHTFSDSPAGGQEGNPCMHFFTQDFRHDEDDFPVCRPDKLITRLDDLQPSFCRGWTPTTTEVGALLHVIQRN